MKKPPSPRTAADGISRWKTEAERRDVNEALDRGATWREIAKICKRHGRDGVTSQNVSNYKKSADRDRWRRLKERLEVIRTESELTAAVVRHYSEQGGSPAEAGLLAAAEILTKAIHGVAPEELSAMVHEDPRKFLSSLESLARVAAYLQRERAAQLAVAAPTITEDTPEARLERERRMRAIFGLLDTK